MAKKNERALNVLGMMSGTSGDGIDGALVRFIDERRFELLWHDSMPFSAASRQRIKHLMLRPEGPEILLGASYVANLYAAACREFLTRNADRPDCIAAHGQTVFHLPEPVDWDGFAVNGSLQLLNGSVLAQATGLPVICNFREADLAAGGQGAPLVPFADSYFFAENLKADRIVVNIGGIANITHLRRIDGKVRVVSAFDTGPGNMLMDAFCQEFAARKSSCDFDGKMAAAGKADKDLVASFMQQSFFRHLPPKSAGREQFGRPALLALLERMRPEMSDSDRLATLLEISVASIASALNDGLTTIRLPVEVVVAGGGALNSELMRRLQQRLGDDFTVCRSEKFGVPVMAREAMAFAALGYAFLCERPAGVPSATGAKKAMILGQLHRAQA